MRWGSMCSCDDPGSRNSPSPACHAKPLAIGISLAEIAGIANSWQQRPARAEPRDWHNACGNCGNPAMVRPPGIATETGVVRKGRKGRKPIFLLYRYESIPVGSLGGKMARQADSSSAVWWANGNCRTWVLWCPLTRGPRRSPASRQKIPNLFNAGKPQTPANGAYLFRPSVSRSSDHVARVGMFETEVFARRQARQLHPAHARDGDFDGVSPGHQWGNKGGKRNTRQPPPGRARCGGHDGVPDAPLIWGPRGPYLPVIPL